MDDLQSRLQHALGDRYRIERELGRGGTGIVFLAADTKHDRHVALKVLSPEIGQSVGSERFLREIRISAQPPTPPG
jgi:serine/threonine-protein kinase